MKALRKTAEGYGKMEYITVNEPYPKKDELKIRVLLTGICGSDIHAFKGEYNKKIPLTLGHEFVGEVTEVGSDVRKFKPEDIVVSETTYEVCEKCRYCYEQDYNLCSRRKGLGTQVDGSFAEYIIVKADRCHQVPKAVNLYSAAMLEPLACCMHAVKEKTVVHSEEKIAVFGPGPIGIILSLVLKSLGAEVILIGINQDEKRLQIAHELGIPHIINSQNQPLEDSIMSLTEDYGTDQVFECSGNIHALHQAMEIVKKKGRIIQEGLFAKNMNPISMDLLIHKEIELIGSRTQKPSSWQLAVQWLEQEQNDLTPLVSKITALENWEEAFHWAMSGEALKVLMVP
ncbi:zinc-binding dehydrogenase [Enterococcus sp. BWT-B8]|uniref:zinc-binding dehydrogenase n=1 Tax=Enterococcus sp. BWT-B8 TaxID=2885157 RepID=UPI001E6095D9|nr:zinc-binding dehydrogenase [Enterococcus sp. BWT-B8]MCB5951446.1 zinc-binding dehydrogenase [Enterococcus sp. BWT-B8]